MQNDILSLKNDLTSLNDSMSNLNKSLQKQKQEIEIKLTRLQTSQNNYTHQFNENLNTLDSNLKIRDTNLNASVSDLSSSLQEHKQQTASELSHFQTSLSSTHSKLDTLTRTTASDHRQIIDNMSDVECMDTEQTLQLHHNLHKNLTMKLEEMKNCLDCYTCGGTGGWRRVVYLNMTNQSTTCPSGWLLTDYSKRSCGRLSSTTRTCDSTIFPVSGGRYSRICGRIRAYQHGVPDAFLAYNRGYVTTIDGSYVSGVSMTHGTPRNHIWTFANGFSEGDTYTSVCPCDVPFNLLVPPFVGNDYFCESGINKKWEGELTFHPNDCLWDGEDCIPSSKCCSLHNPPYFVKQLPNSTNDDIEARLCMYHSSFDDNIAIELLELYVQ